MSNILNHNRLLFNTKINKRDNWDFCLSTDTSVSNFFEKECLISYFDFNNEKCVNEGKIYSLTSWDSAINNGVTLNNIGYTGIDNGLINFAKDRTSNKNFIQILSAS